LTLLTAASLLVNPLNVQALSASRVFWKVLGHTGPIAFSRTGDPATGDFRDANVLREFGDVPGDLSVL
jgi:hypothetical protein